MLSVYVKDVESCCECIICSMWEWFEHAEWLHTFPPCLHTL